MAYNFASLEKPQPKPTTPEERQKRFEEDTVDAILDCKEQLKSMRWKLYAVIIILLVSMILEILTYSKINLHLQ